MKICFFADAFDLHTRKWVNYFVRKGHEVHLISPSCGEGYADGIQFHQLTVPLPQRLWTPLRAINVVARIIKARQLVKEIDPDVINAHYIPTNGFLGAVSAFHPLVLTAWGSDILMLPSSTLYWRYLSKYALKRADIITCDSEILRTRLIELGVNPAAIRLIYHGVDTQKFKPQPGQELRARLGLKGDPVVISTRKLKPVYNVEMFVRAIPPLLQQAPQTRFIIAGDGELRSDLENLAASLGVAEKIIFTGWITAEELSGYLASSDIYVSTSRSDSTSLSLQEAMACELAPVVTDLPANREWVTDGETGYIVPQNDVPAMVDRITNLLKNAETRERFAKEGRKIIQGRAEYETEMDKVEKLFEEILLGRQFRN